MNFLDLHFLALKACSNVTKSRSFKINLVKIFLCSMLLLFFVDLYNRFTSKQIRDIEIELDRIDENAYLNQGNDGEAFVYLTFPLSRFYSDSVDIIQSICQITRGDLKSSGEHYRFSNNAYREERNRIKIDSLLAVFEGIHNSHIWKDIEDPKFYQRITTFTDEIELNPEVLDTRYLDSNQHAFSFLDSLREIHYTHTFKYFIKSPKGNKFCAETYGDLCVVYNNISNLQTVYNNKRSILTPYDISQFYYRIKVRTFLINKLYLQMDFKGDHDFSFMESMPDSIKGKSIHYNFHKNLPFGINNEIIFRVQSEEFEGLQQTRTFILTAIISAIIALLFTSLINIYIEFNNSLNKELDKNRPSKLGSFIPSEKKRKRKHKKYKSRK